MSSFGLDTINRGCLILKPRQPFIDWLNQTDSDEPIHLKEAREDVTAFLIPDFDSNEEADLFVKNNYLSFFEQILEDWITDENIWPKDRTRTKFEQWFDIQIHSMVVDTVDKKIVKEKN